jgi:hypothetical protein
MKKIMIALLIFAVLVFAMLWYHFDDMQINKYPSLTEVKEDNAIERGWIPSNIPNTAYNIAETHNIDTNELFGSFNYKQSDEPNFMATLVPTDANQTFSFDKFLFKVDTSKNMVHYRNKI